MDQPAPPGLKRRPTNARRKACSCHLSTDTPAALGPGAACRHAPGGVLPRMSALEARDPLRASPLKTSEAARATIMMDAPYAVHSARSAPGERHPHMQMAAKRRAGQPRLIDGGR